MWSWGRMRGGHGLAEGPTPGAGFPPRAPGSLPGPASAHLRLELHHALPQLSTLGQRLGLAQPHAHQLVLQLAQDQLPRGLLPAATAG